MTLSNRFDCVTDETEFSFNFCKRYITDLWMHQCNLVIICREYFEPVRIPHQLHCYLKSRLLSRTFPLPSIGFVTFAPLHLMDSIQPIHRNVWVLFVGDVFAAVGLFIDVVSMHTLVICAISHKNICSYLCVCFLSKSNYMLNQPSA